jgi:hypothetical protein
VKKLAAREKWTAEPPSMRWRSPKGVRTESNAIEPTTVSDIGVPNILGRVKAIQIEEFGGPDKLKLVDVPDPEPSNGEVVVDVARSGMNFADTHAIRNDYLAEQSLPLIPGAEVSGRTPDGRRVAAILMTGGYAQKVAVPEPWLVPLPDEVSDDQAAGLLLQGLTAHSCSITARTWRRARPSWSRPRRAARAASRFSSRRSRSEGDRTRPSDEKRSLAQRLGPTRPPTPAPMT